MSNFAQPAANLLNTTQQSDGQSVSPFAKFQNSQLNQQVSYTDYTPTFKAVGGSPTLGNGFMAAKWVRFGHLVHTYGFFTLGSTTSLGTGTFSLSLPFPATGSGILGSGQGIQNSTTNLAPLLVEPGTAFSLTVNEMVFAFSTTHNGPAAGLTNLQPWTWAANDQLAWDVVYETPLR